MVLVTISFTISPPFLPNGNSFRCPAISNAPTLESTEGLSFLAASTVELSSEMTSKAKTKSRKYAAGPNADLHRALGHPLRFRILMMLGEREATSTELAEALDADFNRVCEHVRLLRDKYKLIELVDKDERSGGTQFIYKAVDRPLFEVDEWSKLPPLTRQSNIAAILQAIFDNAARAVAAGVFDAHPRHSVLEMPLILDDQGWVDADESGLQHLENLKRIQAESLQRIIESEGEVEGMQAKSGVILHPAAPAE